MKNLSSKQLSSVSGGLKDGITINVSSNGIPANCYNKFDSYFQTLLDTNVSDAVAYDFALQLIFSGCDLYLEQYEANFYNGFFNAKH